MLGTEVLDTRDGSLTRCCFANVRLPISLAGDGDVTGAGAGAGVVNDESNGTAVSSDSATLATVAPEHIAQTTSWIMRTMADEHDMFIAVAFHNKRWWARFSAQVYLDISDFERGAEVLRGLCERVGRGDVLRVVGDGEEEMKEEEKEKSKEMEKEKGGEVTEGELAMAVEGVKKAE